MALLRKLRVRPRDVFRVQPLDISARAGLVLGAFINGVSFQPNLISRGSEAQAIISGMAASIGFSWASSSHSFLRSAANRLPGANGSVTGRVLSGLAVDAVVATGGVVGARVLAQRTDESAVRALARLGLVATASSALAGVTADLLELRRGRLENPVTTIAVTVGAWAAGYAISAQGSTWAEWRRELSEAPLPKAESGRRRRRSARVPVWAGVAPGPDSARPAPLENGARDQHRLLTEPDRQEDVPFAGERSSAVEDVVREIAVARSAAAGLALTGALFGLTWLESRLSGLLAFGASRAFGGAPDDFRTLGRAFVWASTYAAGWYAFTRVNAALTRVGDKLEPAHAEPPALPETTGGPGSLIPWSAQSRESRRWLTMTLTREVIEEVMGEPAGQPIRVYAPLSCADSSDGRAAQLLAEIDRTNALDRPVFALFSPTGSGYINYVATETLEFLTRGRCASAGLQYSVLPSALSLTKVTVGSDQTRAVANGIVERLLAMPADERPVFVLFGESLGSLVSQDILAGQGAAAMRGIALDAALWVGTPGGSRWRDELWGERPLSEAPGVGPGETYLPRSIGDWLALPDAERERARYVLLQNGNDPVPKFSTPLAWRRPDWLGPEHTRPPGAPRGTSWLPVITFLTTFVDLQNSLTPTPGIFVEGGHDYRRVLPDAVRTTFGLEATPEQMRRVQAALRRRELTWETRRRWAAAHARPESERAEAVEEVVAAVSRWTGRPMDADGVRDLVESRV